MVEVGNDTVKIMIQVHDVVHVQVLGAWIIVKNCTEHDA